MNAANKHITCCVLPIKSHDMNRVRLNSNMIEGGIERGTDREKQTRLFIYSDYKQDSQR